MAITGTFAADFSSFTAAVAGAEVSLKSFEGNSTKVESSLSRMTNSFSGTTIIQAATLMAEAVERVGGTSKLTASELARLGATTHEAIAKMTALGIDVPPGLRKIANETKGVNTPLGSMGDLAKGAAAAFGALFTVRAFTGAVTDLVAYASHLSDLSAKTQIGTSALQAWAAAGGQVGVSLDAMTTATSQLQNRLGSGDKSALGALTALGIKFEDIRHAKPEEQFEMVAAKLKDLTDQTAFVKVGMDLMGKGFLDVAPVIREDLKKLTDQAQQLGVVLDTQTIANLDTLGDSMTSLGGVGRAVLADVLVPFIPLLTQAANAMMGFGHVIENAQMAFEQLLSIGADWMKFFIDAEIRVLKLTNAFGIHNDKIRELGESSLYYGGIAKDLATTQTVVAQVTMDTHLPLVTVRTDYDAVAVAADKAGTVSKLASDTVLGAVLKEAPAVKAVTKEWDAYTSLLETRSIAALQAQAREAIATYDRMAASGQFFRGELEAQLEEVRRTKDAARGMGDDYVDAFTRADKAAEKLTKQLAEQAEAAKAAAANRAMGNATQVDFATQAGRDTVDPAIARWLKDGYSLEQASAIAYTLSWGGQINQNDPLFQTKGPRVPGFAGGVENFAGGQAWVGEQGPELVTLPKGSSVTPAGGGATMINNFYVDGTSDVAARKIMDYIVRQLKQGRQFGAA